VHGILITEILIKLAIAALVIMGTGTKINAAFHMVQAGLFPGRQLPQTILPINDPAALAFRDFTLLPQLAVFSGSASHGPVESAGLAMIINGAEFPTDHPGLHPDAGGGSMAAIIF
jgi:hypothetical protein